MENKMTNYKLLASDIDGTLITTERVLTPETIKAVEYLVNSGAHFVICTGRAYQGAVKISTQLPVKDIAQICYNGAMIYVGDKPVYKLNIPAAQAKRIIKEGHKRNSTMILWRENKLYAETPCEKIDFYMSISGVAPIFVKDLTSVCDDKVIKILWFDDPINTPKYAEELKQILSGQISCFVSRPDFLEFVNSKCSKKTALEFIAKYYGVDIKQTVAVGDSYNDIPMLMGAGYSVAMENAVDAVKNVCDYVTDTCDNNGVAQLIYKVFKNE